MCIVMPTQIGRPAGVCPSCDPPPNVIYRSGPLPYMS